MSRPTLAADLIWGAIAGAAALWTLDQIGRAMPAQPGPPARKLDFSVATVAAAVFTALRARVPYIGAARGIPFGATMFVLEDEVLNPIRRSANPAHAHATGLLTHTGFGLLVDTLLRAMRGR